MLNPFRLLRQPLAVSILWLGISWPKSLGLAESPTPPPLCPADLGQAIEGLIEAPEFQRSRWGISIRTLRSGRTLYRLEADRYFLPASNVKLLTTAAALLQFGSQFRFQTPAYGTGTPPTLKALRLVGQGDPSLTADGLQDLARQLKRQGVRRIETLIVEEGTWEGTGLNPTWEWGDLFFDYAPSVNRSILNENAVTLTLTPQQVGQPLQLEWSDPIAAQQWQVRNETVTAPEGVPGGLDVGGVFSQPVLGIRGQLAIGARPQTLTLAIPAPAQYFLATFRHLLRSEGIEVGTGSVSQRSRQNPWENRLAAIPSQPLEILVKKANQDSNNLFAEALLNLLGNSADAGSNLEALKKPLASLGVDPKSYQLADGSGLSRHNLVSPEALVKTLTSMAGTPVAGAYRNSLAVAGVSGTLKERFKGTAVAGILQAKTGTLSGASSLSGYLDSPSYEGLAFSILVDRSELPASQLRKTIDEIVLLLSRLKYC